jgi:hypothetical protein
LFDPFIKTGFGTLESGYTLSKRFFFLGENPVLLGESLDTLNKEVGTDQRGHDPDNEEENEEHI